MVNFPKDAQTFRMVARPTTDLLLQRHLRADEDGYPLLTLLTERFPYHSQKRWLELISIGMVTVNGVAGDPDQVLSSGDLLAYQARDFSEPEVSSLVEPIAANPDLRLVGKPAGTPVTRTGLIVSNTFINLLRNHYGEELHPLHRLDRETSGILLCARSREACARYQNRAATFITGKYYLAVAHGRMPSGSCCSEQALATRPDSAVRCRMWPENAGKPCRTIFHTLAVTATCSLVLAELRTGRRHQIRAHLACLGHPVVGDKIYSHEGQYFLKRLTVELAEPDYRELGARNHTLHAWATRLDHPDFPEGHYFSQLFSDDFRRYLELFPGWEKVAREKLAEINCAKPDNG